MGFFIRGTGDSRTVLQHEKEIFKQYLLSTFCKELMGARGSGKPIIVDDKKFGGKGAGDTARYHFVPQYFGEGIEGQNAYITGNEKTIEEFFMDIRVDQVAQAFKSKGKVTDLRTIIDLRAEFKDQLANWFRLRTENDIISALTGYTTDGVTKLEGSARNSTALVKGEGRCFRPHKSSGGFETVTVAANATSNNSLIAALSEGDVMNTEILDELQSLAKTANDKYPIKPVKTKDGREMYVLVLHPRAAIALRKDERWEKRALSLFQSSRSLDNDPIATGAIGVWENLIIKEANYIDTYTASGKTMARNLLLGADACLMAYAQTIDYTEQMQDYNRLMGVAADEIRGMKKFCFDDVDLNIAQVPCLI